MTSALGRCQFSVRKRVKGQELHAEFAAALDALAHGARAFLVAEDARQAALFGPAAVAIEDDGDVPGNGAQRALHGERREEAARRRTGARRQTWIVWLRRGPTLTMPSFAPGQRADPLQVTARRRRADRRSAGRVRSGVSQPGISS